MSICPLLLDLRAGSSRLPLARLRCYSPLRFPLGPRSSRFASELGSILLERCRLRLETKLARENLSPTDSRRTNQKVLPPKSILARRKLPWSFALTALESPG